MAVRLAHHRRVATAALLLCVVLATMLVTLAGRGPSANQVDQGRRPGQAAPVAPIGAGVTREVRSPADWEQAVAAAQPGDVIRLRADIGARLVYQGGHDGSGGAGSDGVAGAPIVITADPGVWIDPGNLSSGQAALDVIAADHVHVVGVAVRNAQFGIRCLQCRGSADQPVRLAGDQVTQTGHAGIHVGGHWASHTPSAWVVVEDNVVSFTGQGVAAYGEGIYLGYGGTEWIDTTGDVIVRGNDISFTGAEGVDIKPGTRNITVEANTIHDLAPLNGGAISAHYVNLVPNPHPFQLDAVTIRANRIWNLNLGGVPGSNDWAIWVGHGGVEVAGNWIWSLRSDPAATRAVRIRATQDFGPHPIQIHDNLFWTARGWVAEGQPSGASNVVASGNRGIEAGSSELVIDGTAFPGPVPVLGTGGTADRGTGPGSGLGWASQPVVAPGPVGTAWSPSTTVFAVGSAPADGPIVGGAGTTTIRADDGPAAIAGTPSGRPPTGQPSVGGDGDGAPVGGIGVDGAAVGGVAVDGALVGGGVTADGGPTDLLAYRAPAIEPLPPGGTAPSVSTSSRSGGRGADGTARPPGMNGPALAGPGRGVAPDGGALGSRSAPVTAGYGLVALLALAGVGLGARAARSRAGWAQAEGRPR